ncbi:hypothetical protein [Gimesia sp.]|uniref:hypothetical protein n=1 Tax=Gimesia sp. TaxID=2024833 RepID=UPI003A921EB4
MQELMGLGDVSRLLNIPKHRIDYAISNGFVSEPKVRISNKRAFSHDEVRMIANYFGVRVDNGRDARNGAG